jgi:cell division protein FtsI (penicillin-binding protein 3)
MPITQKRLLQLFAILAAWAVIVIARLVQIQLVRHGEYVVKAARQQERTLALQPVRGSIIDSRGRILAESVAAESIYADPQAIGDRTQTAKALASVAALQMDARDLAAKLNTNAGFVWIAR